MEFTDAIKRWEEKQDPPGDARKHIVAQLGAGKSIAQIAREFGVERTRLYYHLPKMGIHLKRTVVVTEEV